MVLTEVHVLFWHLEMKQVIIKAVCYEVSKLDQNLDQTKLHIGNLGKINPHALGRSTYCQYRLQSYTDDHMGGAR